MNILLIGSGGREHALALALSKSASAGKIYSAPGNPGMSKISELTDLNTGDFEITAKFCMDKNIGLVIVGPEQPLANGITDYITERGIHVFGPGRHASRLESSKEFAKAFMMRHNIPTAAYKAFTSGRKMEAHEYIDTCSLPVVLKADGLAAGKGVIIAESHEKAHETIDLMFGGLFKEAGNTIVIEEFLQGEEASVLAVTDGKDYVTLAPSQDHKRALDGDKGNNTGGMGAYAPAPLVTDEIIAKVEKNIIEPVIKGMAEEGTPFKGCLYAGLMINNGDPYVVEFNVRFGDPETQVVLPILEGDFAALLYSAAVGKLDKSKLTNTASRFACCVIAASNGYPGHYEKGFEITGLKEAENTGAVVYHAGTKEQQGKIFSSGGRVLGITGFGNTLKEAVESSYKALDEIEFANIYYRKDIGLKGLK